MSSLAVNEWATFFSDAEREFGRHTFDDGGVPTPIFDALFQRSGPPEPVPVEPLPDVVDPVVAFERDPLTAPIPVQALVPEPSRPWELPMRSAVPEPVRATTGRHRLRREPVAAS